MSASVQSTNCRVIVSGRLTKVRDRGCGLNVSRLAAIQGEDLGVDDWFPFPTYAAA